MAKANKDYKGRQVEALTCRPGISVRQGRSKARSVARMGLLFALAACLSFFESQLPPLLPVPGIKPGLSNVVTMYAVYALDFRAALTLAAMKAVLALATRGGVAAALSLAGGMLSVAAMLLALRFSGGRAGYAAVSVTGAVCHNIGQLAAAAVILRMGRILWYYLPPLAMAGAVMGLLTAALLRAAMPLLNTKH